MIAQTKAFKTVEGNRYFPQSSLDMQYFQLSQTHTTCPWKGVASYYNVVVDALSHSVGEQPNLRTKARVNALALP